MSDEAAFLTAIKSAPHDSTARLVYADWLDERGRPGGQFLRIECELAALDPATEQRWALLGRLTLAGMGLEAGWVSSVSRVSMREINLRHIELTYRFRYPRSFWRRHAELIALAETEWFRTAYPAARLIGTHDDIWAAQQADRHSPRNLIPFMIASRRPFPDYYGFWLPGRPAKRAAELPVQVWSIHAYVHGWDTGFDAFLDELRAECRQ